MNTDTDKVQWYGMVQYQYIKHGGGSTMLWYQCTVQTGWNNEKGCYLQILPLKQQVETWTHFRCSNRAMISNISEVVSDVLGIRFLE